MPEWSNGTVSKTVVPFRVPRVRIPVFPQTSLKISHLQMSGGKIKGDALILGRFFFHLHEYLNFKIDLSSIKYYEYGYSMKKNQSFRLPIDLIERLKLLARKENRSLNNFVETVLLDAAYHQPYDTTLAAMKEVESGALRNDPAIDLSSISAMEKSKLEP